MAVAPQDESTGGDWMEVGVGCRLVSSPLKRDTNAPITPTPTTTNSTSCYFLLLPITLNPHHHKQYKLLHPITSHNTQPHHKQYQLLLDYSIASHLQTQAPTSVLHNLNVRGTFSSITSTPTTTNTRSYFFYTQHTPNFGFWLPEVHISNNTTTTTSAKTHPQNNHPNPSTQLRTSKSRPCFPLPILSSP